MVYCSVDLVLGDEISMLEISVCLAQILRSPNIGIAEFSGIVRTTISDIGLNMR